MEGEIVNRVANSPLEIFDLEDFYPENEIVTIDISQWLLEGMVLKEKDFRESVKQLDVAQFQSKIVLLVCSTDAIVPIWAYLLLISKLEKVAFDIFRGNVSEYLLKFYSEKLATYDFSKFVQKPVLLKGCSRKKLPESIYGMVMSALQPFAKSIMYGEACSAVPIFKSN